MVEFEKRKSVQDKKSARKEDKVQQQAQKREERTIHSQAIYLEENTICNWTPPTPAHSISPDRDLISSPLSSLSSNSQAVYYRDATAMYGQTQQCTAWQEEEEVAPEDSASIQVSPTHGITNSLEVLALFRDGTFTEEDVVMDHTQPEGFEEALQSFWAVQAKLDDILADESDGEFNVSRQLRWRRARPPKTVCYSTFLATNRHSIYSYGWFWYGLDTWIKARC